MNVTASRELTANELLRELYIVRDYPVLAVERAAKEARRKALNDALTTVRALNGNGHDEPSDPALDAAETALRRMIEGDK